MLFVSCRDAAGVLGRSDTINSDSEKADEMEERAKAAEGDRRRARGEGGVMAVDRDDEGKRGKEPRPTPLLSSWASGQNPA